MPTHRSSGPEERDRIRGHQFAGVDPATRPTTTRTRTAGGAGIPLIYRAVSSWFLHVTEFRDRMVDLNRRITWYPEHVRRSVRQVAINARDWSISRNRYWALRFRCGPPTIRPRPRIDVYGSLDELERDFGVRPDNLHRPYIDGVDPAQPVYRHVDDAAHRGCVRRLVRLRVVPFGQVHYPFENEAGFPDALPRRLHRRGTSARPVAGSARCTYWRPRCSTARRSKTCVARHRVGNDGAKMSKSLRNYPDVNGCSTATAPTRCAGF